MIKEIFKGESCTLMFAFPEAYDMGRINSHKVYIGIQNYIGVVDGQSIILKLKSSDTDKLCGVQKVVLWFDDSTLGLRKPYCGDLVISKTKAEADNESESDIYDIIIPIVISETSVTVGDILYNYVKGANGTNGRGISSIILVSTVGLVKTYRITYTDSTTFEYSVSDGSDANIVYSVDIEADKLSTTKVSAIKTLYDWAVGLFQKKTLYFSNKSVLTTDFVVDTTYVDYGFKAVITCTGVTSADVAEVIFAPTESDSGNFASVTATGTDTVTIYAKAVPSGTIIIPTILITKL